MAVFYVNQNAIGNNDGNSWENAFTDLQAALEIATPNDEIWVAGGTYKPTVGTNRGISFDIPSGVAVYGGFAGGEASLEQRNWINNVTILSGDIGQEGVGNDNSNSVVDITDTTPTTVIDGFTISDANGDGGITGGAANATLSNLIIRDNNAEFGGGYSGFGSDVTFTNVSFINNFAEARGGAIRSTLGTTTVENGLFIGNVAQQGGAIEGLANVTNSTFYNNQAPEGSAILLFSRGSTNTIENSIFFNNSGSEDDNQIVARRGEIVVNNSIVEDGYSGPGTGIIDADPLFVDPSNNNFRLQSTSPAIDVGNNNVVNSSTDILNNPRIFNNIVDFGAIEYIGDGNEDITGETTELINNFSQGYYNSAIGDLYPGNPTDPLAAYFPGPDISTGSPTADFSIEPDISIVSELGSWLDNPEAALQNEYWSSLQSIPRGWDVNTETAIIYEVDGGENGIKNVTADFSIDNSILVWVNGEYRFGSGNPPNFEVNDADLGDLNPGKNYIQVLRADYGVIADYQVQIMGEI